MNVTLLKNIVSQDKKNVKKTLNLELGHILVNIIKIIKHTFSINYNLYQT